MVTTVLKLRGLDENTWNEGSPEIGICVVDLVVGTIVARSEGIGPVTVGYMPVQYDTVVVISGVGKTKLTDVSPYDMILVVRSRTTADVTLSSVGVEVCMVIEPLTDVVEIEPEPMIKVDDEEVEDRVKLFDDEEELVNLLLDEDVVFTGGTRVTKTLEKLVPGTPPVVVVVDIVEEIDKVLAEVRLSELDDDAEGTPLGMVLANGTVEAKDPPGLDTVGDNDAAGVVNITDVVTATPELAVLEIADVVKEAELDDVLEVDMPLGTEVGDVEDEGQENMLELAVGDDLPESFGGKVVVLELAPLEGNGDEDTVTDTAVVDKSVRVVVTPEVTCVTVCVMTEGTAVATTLLGREEGFGSEIVKPPLDVGLPGLEEDDDDAAELLEDAESDEGVLARDIVPIVVVKTRVIVVVCPPGRELVSVVRMLDMVGDGRLEGMIFDDGPLVIEVLVNVVGGPPGNVLVNVITPFDDENTAEGVEGPVDEGLTTMIDVLVRTVVSPPEMVLVRVTRLLEVIGGMLLGLTDDGTPMTVVEVPVKVVIGPPDIVLISVKIMLEVAAETELMTGTGGTPLSVVAMPLVRIVV